MIVATTAETIFTIWKYANNDDREGYPVEVTQSRGFADMRLTALKTDNPQAIYKIWPATVWKDEK